MDHCPDIDAAPADSAAVTHAAPIHSAALTDPTPADSTADVDATATDSTAITHTVAIHCVALTDPTPADSTAVTHAARGDGAALPAGAKGVFFHAEVAFIKPLGFAVFALGMLLFSIAAGFLKKAFQGNIEPLTAVLITTGPYQYVRHPLYLGMVVSVSGIALGLKSLWGLPLTLFAFVPLSVYRARLEEEALARKFGPAWEAYARRTRFMFPLL